MRRCYSSDADDLCRYLRAACGMDSDGGSYAAGDVHGGIQLSLDLGGDIPLIYHLLSERKLAEAVPGCDIIGCVICNDAGSCVEDPAEAGNQIKVTFAENAE